MKASAALRVVSQSAPASVDAINTEFVRLLAKHERRVYAYILSLVPHWADAEEILQETFARLWEQRAQWESDKDFGAWARTIAHYQVLTFRRERQREKLVFSDAFVEMVADQWEDDTEFIRVRQSALVDCAAKLSRMARELVELVYQESLTVHQAAERTGRSAAATYKALARTRRTLHDCIERSVRRQGPG